MADIVLFVLLLWHISSMVAWYGSIFAFVFSTSPSLRMMALDDQHSFLRNFIPKYARTLAISSVSTMLAGLILFSYINTVNTHYVLSDLSWIVITLGAILGLVSGFVTLGGLLPLASKLQKSLSIEAPPTSSGGRATLVGIEQESPVIVISRVIFVMLSLVLMLMILGVYI
jgi:hypothetical protein